VIFRRDEKMQGACVVGACFALRRVEQDRADAASSRALSDEELRHEGIAPVPFEVEVVRDDRIA